MHRSLSSPAWIRRGFVALVIAVPAVLAVAVAATAGTPVVVVADDELHELRVSGDTVADVLSEAEIELEPGDEVAPPPDTSVDALAGDGLAEVVVDRAITVTVEVDDASQHRVTAPVSTVAAALGAAELTDVRRDGARITPGWTDPVEDGDTIRVVLPVEVTVEVDDEEIEIATHAARVRTVLRESGVDVGPDDIVEPAEHSPLSGTSTVTVKRVEIVEETEEVTLEHDEVRRETDELDRGSTRVEQEGRDGLRVDTYEVTLVDGEETDRELVDEEVVTELRDQVVLVGTRTRSAASGGVWDRLAQCESNGNWQANTGNGYYGGLQFLPSTWRSVGGTGLPHQHSRAEQIRRAEILQQRSGWGQWPACSRRLGLR